MQVIRYDHEFALAECAKALLIDADNGISAEALATHPAVAWFDPAAWESGANRIVTLCTDGSSSETSKANATMTLEVGVRTVMPQASGPDAYARHRFVTDTVRAYFAKPVDTMLALLNAKAEKGFQVYYCEERRDYSSDFNGNNFYSSVKFGVKCISVREEEA